MNAAPNQAESSEGRAAARPSSFQDRDSADADAPFLIALDQDDLARLCREAGASEAHAERIFAHLHRRNRDTLEDLPDLPQRLRAHLAARTRSLLVRTTAERAAADGTRKLLLAMPDAHEIETVLIPGANRLTQCISTQVGCAIGCTFCLTATAGLTRHLSAAEMLAQAKRGRQLGPVRNLVLMGMGEPLHNYDEVARFVRLATDPKGMAFSPNRVTLSTAGLVPGIRRMAREDLPCNLAVSLNATTDAVRDAIMPINRKYPIAMLMEAVRDYIARRGGKRVLIEYVMLAGVNDSDDDARRLISLLAGLDCTVNLLPFNAHPGSRFQRPAEARVNAFRARLIEAGFVAVVRESRGREILAACGQLKTETQAAQAKTRAARARASA